MRIFRTICLITGAFLSAAHAQNGIDESALFGDTNMVIDSQKIVNTAAGDTANLPKKTVGFSGQIISAAAATASRDLADTLSADMIGFSGSMVGNLMLDVRLINGIKAFANLEAAYAASQSQMLINLREIFVDANIQHRVYLRAGKQVLQWGPCNFWNPTDLINVEKKLFVQKIGYREGAFGLRAHVPFGTAINLYGFLDAKDVSSADSLAAAAKMEFLAGGTEFAFSTWGKRNREPVFGFDISTALAGVNIAGEVSASYGSNGLTLKEGPIAQIPVMVNDTDTIAVSKKTLIMYRKDDTWIPRAAVGLTKWFDFLDVHDRIMAIAEFYYNGAGYTTNVFADRDTGYLYDVPVKSISEIGIPDVKTSGTKTDYLVGHDLFEQNSYSQYYLVLFISISRFITSSMSLNLNAIGNLKQRCAAVSAGVTYTSLSDFSLGATIVGYIGAKNTEYTYQNNAVMVQVTAGMTF